MKNKHKVHTQAHQSRLFTWVYVNIVFWLSMVITPILVVLLSLRTRADRFPSTFKCYGGNQRFKDNMHTLAYGTFLTENNKCANLDSWIQYQQINPEVFDDFSQANVTRIDTTVSPANRQQAIIYSKGKALVKQDFQETSKEDLYKIFPELATLGLQPADHVDYAIMAESIPDEANEVTTCIGVGRVSCK